MRNWQELQNDEIAAIWSQYLKHEGCYNGCFEAMDYRGKPMRLTFSEIVRLVDVLLTRVLEKQEEK